jgi:hypothetical protein
MSHESMFSHPFDTSLHAFPPNLLIPTRSPTMITHHYIVPSPHVTYAHAPPPIKHINTPSPTQPLSQYTLPHTCLPDCHRCHRSRSSVWYAPHSHSFWPPKMRSCDQQHSQTPGPLVPCQLKHCERSYKPFFSVTSLILFDMHHIPVDFHSSKQWSCDRQCSQTPCQVAPSQLKPCSRS